MKSASPWNSWPDELLGLVAGWATRGRAPPRRPGAAGRPRCPAPRAPCAGAARARCCAYHSLRHPPGQRAREHHAVRAARTGSGSSPSSTASSASSISGPYSLISVWRPTVGSITTVEARDSSRMRTKSLSSPSRVSSSTMRVPFAPPARPVATTGSSSRLSARATLMPLPPAWTRPCWQRCRCPSWKFGDVEGLVEGGVRRDGDEHAARRIPVADPGRRSARRPPAILARRGGRARRRRHRRQLAPPLRPALAARRSGCWCSRSSRRGRSSLLSTLPAAIAAGADDSFTALASYAVSSTSACSTASPTGRRRRAGVRADRPRARSSGRSRRRG